MAVVTLIEYLKNERLSSNIFVNDVLLRDVFIEHYEISNDKLWLLTSSGHEVDLNLHDFITVDFDAIISIAYNSKDMVNCLRDLEEDMPYNAYLRDSKNNIILSFYQIKKKSILK